jgi:hypothetical protein
MRGTSRRATSVEALLAGVDAADAARRLERAHGRVRDALA